MYQQLALVAALALASTVVQAQDSEADGSPDAIENSIANHSGNYGDGNLDGIADSQQPAVVSGYLAQGSSRGRDNSFTALLNGEGNFGDSQALRFANALFTVRSGRHGDGWH